MLVKVVSTTPYLSSILYTLRTPIISIRSLTALLYNLLTPKVVGYLCNLNKIKFFICIISMICYTLNMDKYGYQNKKTGKIIQGKLIKAYPKGWSVLTSNGLKWLEKQWHKIVRLK